MRWIDLREEEFEKAIEISGGVCVMPVACVEKHGQHLPLGTDVKISETVAYEAAEQEDVCIFPTFYFGDVQGIRQHRGAVVLSPAMQVEILEALCDEIARNGFKKILLVNGHGGNGSMLDTLVNTIIHKKRDYAVLYRHAFDYSLDDFIDDIDAGKEAPDLTEEEISLIRDFAKNGKLGGHADFEETAVLMAIAPDLVKLDRAYTEDGLATHRTDEYAALGMARATRFWYLEYPNHYAGHHPMGASARIGHALLDKWVARQARAVRLLKKDDRILEWDREWHEKWVE